MSDNAALDWTLLLGLLAASAGCATGGGSCTASPPECGGRNDCSVVVVDADGGVVTDGGVPDGGREVACGCCIGNG